MKLRFVGWGPIEHLPKYAEILDGVEGLLNACTIDSNTDGPPHAACSGQIDADRWYDYIARCDGELTVTNPLAPHLGHRLVLRDAGGETTEQVEGDTTYTHQLRAFRDWLAGGPPMPTDGYRFWTWLPRPMARRTRSGASVRAHRNSLGPPPSRPPTRLSGHILISIRALMDLRILQPKLGVQVR